MSSERSFSSVSENNSYSITNHPTLHLGSPTSPPVSLAAFNTPSTPSQRNYPCPISSTPLTSLQFPQGQVFCVVDRRKRRYCKTMFRQRAISSTANLPATNAPTQFGVWACSTPAMNPSSRRSLTNGLTQRLRQHKVGILFPQLYIVYGDSFPNALSSSKTSAKNPGSPRSFKLSR